MTIAGCFGFFGGRVMRVGQAALALWLGGSTALITVSSATELKQITILGTNDIHGHVEQKALRDGTRIGGLPQWASVVGAIRKGVESQGGGFLLLDGGDQFQGTLLSNYDEGSLVIDLMSAMGYDAVVPGNHDYDFGPDGWLVDLVPPGAEGDPRGVLKRLQERAKFPFVSANTYYSASLRDVATGLQVPVASKGCAPLVPSSEAAVDWSNAQRLELVEPYRIVEVAGGVRVALIGLDHAGTGTMTTLQNVQDLCFRDEVETYLELRRELEGRADVFVILIHGGNINQDNGLTEMVEHIQAQFPGGVDAVVGGHTHSVNRVQVAGVPLIQSGAHGERFGRIDLFFDPESRRVVQSETRFGAGIPIFDTSCPREAQSYCQVLSDSGKVSYDGVELERREDLLQRVARAQQDLGKMADRVLGKVERRLTRNRTGESSLSNAITDAMREVSGAEIALTNSGGLRADLPEGAFTYKQLFEVLPFNNRAVVMGAVRFDTLKKLLTLSIQTCGAYGALLPSGLRVEFMRDCRESQGKTDLQARLTRVERVSMTGEVLEVLLEADASGKVIREVAPDRTFQVITLDFLAAGGSGYSVFPEAKVSRDLGILREVFAEQFQKQPAVFSGKLDGRWKESLSKSR